MENYKLFRNYFGGFLTGKVEKEINIGQVACDPMPVQEHYIYWLEIVVKSLKISRVLIYCFLFHFINIINIVYVDWTEQYPLYSFLFNRQEGMDIIDIIIIESFILWWILSPPTFCCDRPIGGVAAVKPFRNIKGCDWILWLTCRIWANQGWKANGAHCVLHDEVLRHRRWSSSTLTGVIRSFEGLFSWVTSHSTPF